MATLANRELISGAAQERHDSFDSRRTHDRVEASTTLWMFIHGSEEEYEQ